MTKSAYVHVPFCRSICAYCDFARTTYQTTLIGPWLTQLKKEAMEKINGSLQTLYIGGGTPNALSYQELDALLSIFDPFYRTTMEYTMEVNPELLDAEIASICAYHGVNRISMGVQSFDDQLLKMMNRHHRSDQVLEKLKILIAAGIQNLSIDLIYGLPGQTLAMWKKDLMHAVSLPIQHISLYSLTIEENSVFGKRGIQKADDEIEYLMYAEAIKYLEKHGFKQYEIANFSKNGACSRHNLTYWQYEDFYGIGCGASGKTALGRYDNTRSLNCYLKDGPCPEWTKLNDEEQMFEMVMMGLRLNRGISLDAFEQRYHIPLTKQFEDAIQKHLGNDLIIEEGYLHTTEKGKFLLHEILIDFL